MYHIRSGEDAVLLTTYVDAILVASRNKSKPKALFVEDVGAKGPRRRYLLQ